MKTGAPKLLAAIACCWACAVALAEPLSAKIARCPKGHADIQAISIVSGERSFSSEEREQIENRELLWWGCDAPPARTAYVCRVCAYIARPNSPTDYRWHLAEGSTNINALTFALPAPLNSLSVALSDAGVGAIQHTRREIDGVLVNHSVNFNCDDSNLAAQLPPLAETALRDSNVSNLVVNAMQPFGNMTLLQRWTGEWEGQNLGATIHGWKHTLMMTVTINEPRSRTSR
jgi:hypothetical protein